MKATLKFLVFRVLCPILVFFRMDKLLQILSTHKRMIIFFHGVSNEDLNAISGAHMQVNEFERLLRYLMKNFDIISLRDLCQGGKNASPFSRKTIALTFDDGLLNNLEVAFPVLLRNQVPATFFISTASLNDPNYIHPSDLIDMLKFSSKGAPIEINGERFVTSGNALVRDRDGLPVIEYINGLSFYALRAAMDEICHKYGRERLTEQVPSAFYKLVSAQNIREFDSSNLITLGSHSHYHVNMNVLTIAEITEQLASSKDAFAQCNITSVKDFAFPYGYFSEEAVSLAEKNGFEYLFAGGSVPRDSKVFPRIGVLSMRGYSYSVLSISGGFGRFGF